MDRRDHVPPERGRVPDGSGRGDRGASQLVGGVMLLAVGLLWLLDVADVVAVGWRSLLPVGLAIVGLAVLVVSLWTRADELIGIGVVLTVLVVASALLPEQLSTRVGERLVRPVTAGELRDGYAHGIGELTIDLRDLDLDSDQFAGNAGVSASLGVGELRVRAPAEATVVVSASTGVGEATLFGRSQSGFAVELVETSAVESGPVLRLDLSVGIGQIEVTR